MKKIKPIDLIVLSYCLYFSITLSIDPNMFDQDSELYNLFQQINSNEFVWGMASLVVAVLYFISFIFKQKWISVIASLAGGLFFIIVGSAYMLTYPNIGSGIFTIIGIVCFVNISSITVEDETIIKEEINHGLQRRNEQRSEERSED